MFRGAYASAVSRQSLRCSYTIILERDDASVEKLHTAGLALLVVHVCLSADHICKQIGFRSGPTLYFVGPDLSSNCLTL